MKLFKLLLVLLFLTLPLQASDQDPPSALPNLPDELLLLEPEWVCRRHVTNLVKPTYPEDAQKLGMQGEVLAFVWFDKDGKLIEAKVLRSSHRLLSDAVLSVLKEWRVAPNAPLYPDANYMSELRFVFVLRDGSFEVTDAEEGEQQKVSSEFTKEISKRKKKSSR